MGTGDPTAWMAVPAAIETMAKMAPGGWPGLMRRNRALALHARDVLCGALCVPAPCPDAMIGTLAAVPMPDRPAGIAAVGPHGIDPIQAALETRDRIEVPIMVWPRAPQRWVRVSAQAYNHPAQYRRLGDRLRMLLAEGL